MDQDQLDSLQHAQADATIAILAAIEREAGRTDGERGAATVLTLTRALGHMSTGWFAHAPNRRVVWTSFRAGENFEQDEDEVDDDLDDDDSTASATAPDPDMWEIKLVIETDDAAAVERISDAVALAVCPVPFDRMTAAHQCEVPWMIATSELTGDEAEGWRGTLNR